MIRFNFFYFLFTINFDVGCVVVLNVVGMVWVWVIACFVVYLVGCLNFVGFVCDFV